MAAASGGAITLRCQPSVNLTVSMIPLLTDLRLEAFGIEGTGSYAPCCQTFVVQQYRWE